MSEVKVSELPEASSVNDEDLVMIVQNGVNKKVQKSKVRDLIVSSTEPTTGEKVWLKKGNNLLNKNIGFINFYISATGEIMSGNNNALFNQKIRVLPSTDYTISCNSVVNNFAFAFYDKNNQFISRESLNNRKTMTKTSPANAKYLKVQFNYDNVTTVTQSIIDSLNIMLNQGSSVLQYEDYVEKGIYILNNNNVYLPYLKIEDIDDKYYNPGDRYISSTNVSHEGFVSGGGKDIYVTLKPPKRLDKVSSVAVNTLKLNIRGISGYIGTSGADFKSYVSSAIIPSSKDAIVIVLTNSSGWGATNNTPVVVAGASAIELTFS